MDAEPSAHTNHPPTLLAGRHQAPGREEFLWKLEPAMPAEPGWLGVGAALCHMVWATWAWRGSDSWRVGSWRWPEPCSSQPVLGLGAAACSRLRQFVGGWMRLGCGCDASEVWGHQAGQKVHTLHPNQKGVGWAWQALAASSSVEKAPYPASKTVGHLSASGVQS